MNWKIILSLLFIKSLNCSEIENNISTVKEQYCFRFTWLGPKYNSESHFRNATCADVVKGDKTVPCVHPLVVTNNSNVPDMKYIWEEYRDTPSMIACKSLSGEACVKFTYRFNGAIENVTYLCSKVNIVNETTVSRGCYKQIKDGHEVEVCVCQTEVGRFPCNFTSRVSSPILFLLIMIISFEIVKL